MGGVVLVLGKERFLARLAVQRALDRAGDAERTRLRGAEVSTAALLDDLRTPSLFGRPRVLAVEEAGELWKEEPEALGALAGYAERPAANAQLILQADSLDRRRRDAKRLVEAAEVVRCDPVPQKTIGRWLAAHARDAHGLRLQPAAIPALCERVGEDPGRLDAALERLKEQIAPRTELRGDDVAESTEEHRAPVVFEASNALEARDLAACLAAVRSAFAEGVRIRQDVVSDPRAVAPILLGQLHRSWSRVLGFALARKAGADDREAARAVGAHGGQVYHLVEACRRLPLPALVARHRHFVEADLELKSDSAKSPQVVLESLLMRLLGPLG